MEGGSTGKFKFPVPLPPTGGLREYRKEHSSIFSLVASIAQIYIKYLYYIINCFNKANKILNLINKIFNLI